MPYSPPIKYNKKCPSVMFTRLFLFNEEVGVGEEYEGRDVYKRQEQTSGLLSIFLMAFTLSLVSFSCTGPVSYTHLSHWHRNSTVPSMCHISCKESKNRRPAFVPCLFLLASNHPVSYTHLSCSHPLTTFLSIFLHNILVFSYIFFFYKLFRLDIK